MNEKEVKTKEKRRLRRFLWSGNAKEHGDAVMRYAVYSSAVAGTVSLAAFGVVGAIEKYEPIQRAYAVMAIVFCWMAVWALMFGIMIISYASLITLQYETINPPTPPKPDREVLVYQRENNQTKLLKRTVKRGSGKS